MHHRIVFVAKNTDITYQDFHLGWQMVHSRLLTPTVNLRGYVQNRPVAAQWGRGLYDGVAELWYDSATLEQEAFDSHQSKVIREHEHSFMSGEKAFSALVEETVLVPGRQTGSRILAFGADPSQVPEWAVAATLLKLDAAEPHTGADSVLSVWTASEPDAFAVKDALGGESLVVSPAPIVTPPLWPWDGSQPPAIHRLDSLGPRKGPNV
ncbi:EthD family reductase [Arthrobacter sp. NPDC080031]|uniref:EthD family reductase n=1 Tax=Arthrobacter sp. NPDC080031 TaxID=3155918 RepID=UPI00344F8B26